MFDKLKWFNEEVKIFLNGIFLRLNDLVERGEELDVVYKEGFYCCC